MTWPEARNWLELVAEGKRGEQRWELAKMEWLAAILGVNWKAPGLGTEIGPTRGGCNRAECEAKYGVDIDWACNMCPDKVEDDA